MTETKPERREFEREGVFFLIYRNGRFLFEERTTSSKPYFGYVIIPGGKVERGKDLGYREAAIREAREECGIEVTEMVHLDTFLHVAISNHLYKTAAFLILDYKGDVRNIEGKSKHVWEDLEVATDVVLFADSRYVIGLAKRHLAGQNG